MTSFLTILKSCDFPVALSRFSALDHYYKIKSTLPVTFWAACGLTDLAKSFDELEFPGLEHCDAQVTLGERRGMVSICDSFDSRSRETLPIMNFLYLFRERRFFDAVGDYTVYRKKRLHRAQLVGDSCASGSVSDRVAADLAVLVGRYGFSLPDDYSLPAVDAFLSDADPLGPEEQRDILLLILEGKAPYNGLDILYRTGFVAMHWPELAATAHVEQSKEFHPEGNVWEHTLETLKHRKTADLPLTLALLLHDIGKPAAEEYNGNRFHRHAQIGRGIAERFMRRLEFDGALADEAAFLVDQHMLPAAIPVLPTFRTEDVMSSPLFPKLLELYRCDIASSFKGLDGYYEACKAYRAFLRNRKNPFRSADGKKLLRLYVEA